MIFDLANLAASALVHAFLDRRAGPETPTSEQLADEAANRRREIDRLQVEIAELEKRRLLERRKAKQAAPGWFAVHREALLVNIVAGLIYSVPLLIIGIVIGKAID